MKIVTFKLEEELLDAINMYAARRNMVRSEVIRRALRYYLANNRVIRTRRLTIYGGVNG